VWLVHQWPGLQRVSRIECVQLVLSAQNESCRNSASILFCLLWPLGWGWDSCHPQSVGRETHPVEHMCKGEGVVGLYALCPATSCVDVEHKWYEWNMGWPGAQEYVYKTRQNSTKHNKHVWENTHLNRIHTRPGHLTAHHFFWHTACNLNAMGRYINEGF